MVTYYLYSPSGMLLGGGSGDSVPPNATPTAPPLGAIRAPLRDAEGALLVDQDGSLVFSEASKLVRWDGEGWRELDEVEYARHVRAHNHGVQAAIVPVFDTALTSHFDATAQQRKYDNRITCMVRAGFAGPFQAEGQAFATWCDTCNIAAYTMLAAVQAGTAPMPESPQAFIDTLPVMVWPA